jgi:hypothetical protein
MFDVVYWAVRLWPVAIVAIFAVAVIWDWLDY